MLSRAKVSRFFGVFLFYHIVIYLIFIYHIGTSAILGMYNNMG